MWRWTNKVAPKFPRFSALSAPLGGRGNEFWCFALIRDAVETRMNQVCWPNAAKLGSSGLVGAKSTRIEPHETQGKIGLFWRTR